MVARSQRIQTPRRRPMTTTDSDTAALEEFLGKVASDAATTFHAATVLLGDNLGLYKSLAEGPATADELAARTGFDARYLREWVNAQIAAGYCDYDPASGQVSLNAAQATVLADDESPAFLGGVFALAAAVIKDEERLNRDAVRTGAGVG